MAYTNTIMRELRTPLSGSFAYASGCGEAGRAVWLNISRTGAAIQLGRYLRPGHLIQLSLESGNDGGWSIPARIAWCVSIPGTLQFQAGLAVQRTSPESALQFATLGYEALALKRNAAFVGNRTLVFPSLLEPLRDGRDGRDSRDGSASRTFRPLLPSLSSLMSLGR